MNNVLLLFGQSSRIQSCRIKKRKREGIEYESIDALLKVTLAGITRETSAQVGEVSD